MHSNPSIGELKENSKPQNVIILCYSFGDGHLNSVAQNGGFLKQKREKLDTEQVIQRILVLLLNEQLGKIYDIQIMG